MTQDLLKEGGPWLGAARAWLQGNKHNGERVTWGSGEVVSPPMTVRDCEEMAASAVLADRVHRAHEADWLQILAEVDNPCQ
jgi:hypothetical protein